MAIVAVAASLLVVAPASAVDTGTISGHVTITGGANALDGCVFAYGADLGALDYDCADNAGNYTITGLPAGPVYLAFVWFTGGAYSWYGGATHHDASTAVTVVAGSTATANMVLAPAGYVSGHVTITGGANALGGCVDAYNAYGDFLNVACVDGTGNYAIDGLPAGPVYLEFWGFWGGIDTWFGGGADPETSTPVKVVAGSTTTTNMVLQPSGQRFSDVPVSHPYATYITWLADAGITSGYADGSFGVTDPVTRGQMAVFMYRLAGSPAYTPPATSQFSDVPVSHPYFKYVSWLASKSITSGYADGRFGVTDSVTRGQMAVFMYRLAGSPAYTSPASSQFTDVATSHSQYKYVSWLASKSITSGYADGSFGATDPVTRGQMAVFMFRYAQLPD